MKKDFALTQEDFDALLGWLSADLDEAGASYEKIREGLIRFFRFRGCADSHTLADETINRVASKISTFDSSQNVKPITYFYGFASKVLLEYSRTAGKREVSLDAEDFSMTAAFKMPNEASGAEHDCLEECLKKLSAEEYALVIGYYGKDKIEKIEARKKLAEENNLTLSALHTKVFRLRSVLRECIEKCLDEK